MHGSVGSRFVTAAAVLVTLLAGQAAAGEPRTHDGFFLRLAGGVGTAETELDDPSGSVKLDGGTADLNIAIGGMVARNLAIHGTLWGWFTSEPDVEIDGVDAGSAANTDLDMSAIGVGITYYVMPANLYLSGSIGGGQLTLETPLGDADTDTGPVIDLTIGKEWWVGNSWGLGVSGSIGMHAIPDGGIDESWKGASLALRFSATLN